MAAHPAHLSEPSQHDDDGGIVFPQHAPEVLGALSQRPLSGYVGLLLSGVDTRLHMLEVPLPMESPRGAPAPITLLQDAHSARQGWPYSLPRRVLTYSRPGNWR